MKLEHFQQTAKSLSKNPLGIIALFIVMVYAIAALVLNFASAEFYQYPYHPAVIFMVSFPLCVLVVFTYLVSRHHQKLYSPSDFTSPGDFAKTFSIKTKDGEEVKISNKGFEEVFDSIIDSFKKMLNDEQIALYQQLVSNDEPTLVSDVIPNFDRTNPNHIGMLRSLRGLSLIKPYEEGAWDSNKKIVLTELGRKIAKYIK